jgi:excisionase family DNA binding protein
MIEKLGYSIDEAASAAGVGRTAINKLIAAGILESRKEGNCTVIPAESLRGWLAPTQKSAA